MKVEEFVSSLNADFFTGVPDSQLKALCDYLMDVYGIDPKHHIIAANEGNCAALAAGYYLASGKIPVVYMQNSGEGNIINPAASLLNENVYGIPVLFVIGWRGEPGVHDEPQHIYQGMVTLKLLEDMDISAYDALFLGFPDWCGTMPRPVFTFLRSHDFSGKRIFPFCTSGGSGLGSSISDIKATAPGAYVSEGFHAAGHADDESIVRWIERLA